MPATTYQLTLAFPDFSQYKVIITIMMHDYDNVDDDDAGNFGFGSSSLFCFQVNDLFRGLGPVAVFSAKHHWTAPRTIQLRKKEVRVNLFLKRKEGKDFASLRRAQVLQVLFAGKPLY